MLDLRKLRAHRLRNNLQSVLILAGIAGWMALIGWVVGGWDGVLWAVLGTLPVLLIQPMQSPAMMGRMLGAVRLGPLEAPELLRAVAELAARARLAGVPSVLYIPVRQPSAFSAGWGENAVIGITDGLLRALDGSELLAVLAHETSHIGHGDVRILALADAASRFTHMVSLVGLILLALLAMPGTPAEQVPWLAIPLLLLAPVVSDLLQLWLSRTREFAADAGAVGLVGDPLPLAAALARLERIGGERWEGLLRGGPWRWLRLVRTHPTTAERIERLAELAPPPRTRPVLVVGDMLVPGALAGRLPGRWRQARVRPWI